MMQLNICLDFETYSPVDLKKSGVSVYADDPRTEVICLCYRATTVDHGTGIHHWSKNGTITPGVVGAASNKCFEDLVSLVASAIENSMEYFFVAHNAEFDWQIFHKVFARQTDFYTAVWHKIMHVVDTRPGEIELDIVKRWTCTMLRSAYYGGPMGLDTCLEAWGVNYQKDAAGRRAMLRLSKPNTSFPVDTPSEDLEYKHDRAKLNECVKYCEIDTKAVEDLHNAIPRAWANTDASHGIVPYANLLNELTVDQAMAQHGLPIDTKRVATLGAISTLCRAALNNRLAAVTNSELTNTNANIAIMNWINDKLPDAANIKITSLSKTELPKVRRQINNWAKLVFHAPDAPGKGDALLLADQILAILDIREEAAKSSTAKLSSMVASAGEQDRCRGVFQFYGATRTGRYAGRLIQPQNFPRPQLSAEEIERNFQALDLGFKSLSDFNLGFVRDALRSCIAAPKDRIFYVIDFSQIEARVLAWMAGQIDVLKVFANGGDVYVHAAHKVNSRDRLLGKVLTLACGYGMGGPKFQDTAEGYGIEMDEASAKRHVTAWRNANNYITEFWKDTEKAVVSVLTELENGATQTAMYRAGGSSAYVQIWCEVEQTSGRRFLRICLPSGRSLWYLDPAFVDGDITYMGLNQYTRKWERIKTYGGKLVENIVQAVARDVMMELAVILAQDHNFSSRADIIGTVHDELIIETYQAHREYVRTLVDKTALEFLSRDVPWLYGLPIDGEGYLNERYKK